MKSTNRLLLDTLNEERQWLKDRISRLPVGYVNEKYIYNKSYYYLQHREGNRVISVYVPTERIPTVRRKIRLRKFYEKQLKAVNAEIDAIA